MTAAESPARPPARAASAGETALRRLAFPALGTTCEVQYVAPAGAASATAFERAVMGWVSAFEAKYSRFRPTSLVSRINDAAGRAWVEVDADMEQMLALGDALHATTGGVLDPTALPLLRLWNWKAERPTIPAEAQIAAARRLVGWDRVRRAPGRIFLPEPGMALDFGGFGKEYAVDIVSHLARQHGIATALVDFGRDVYALGRPPARIAWHLGLEDPRHPGAAWGSLAVRDGRGVASSGDYVRCFHLHGRRYGHIVDPRTGWPVANGCLQVTVVADTCLQAGVLATAAFVLGAERGLELIAHCPGAEGVIVTETARHHTRGFYAYVAS